MPEPGWEGSWRLLDDFRASRVDRGIRSRRILAKLSPTLLDFQQAGPVDFFAPGAVNFRCRAPADRPLISVTPEKGRNSIQDATAPLARELPCELWTSRSSRILRHHDKGQKEAHRGDDHP